MRPRSLFADIWLDSVLERAGIHVAPPRLSICIVESISNNRPAPFREDRRTRLCLKVRLLCCSLALLSSVILRTLLACPVGLSWGLAGHRRPRSVLSHPDRTRAGRGSCGALHRVASKSRLAEISLRPGLPLGHCARLARVATPGFARLSQASQPARRLAHRVIPVCISQVTEGKARPGRKHSPSKVRGRSKHTSKGIQGSP